MFIVIPKGLSPTLLILIVWPSILSSILMWVKGQNR